jgi:uncharacterized protein
MNFDREWNAGELGCGDLVLELRLKLRESPGNILKVIALDPDATADIPACCRMTGNKLVAQDLEDMLGKYVVSLTHGLDNPDKATVAFVVSNAAIADSIHEEGFAPLRDLMGSFAKAGGKMYVCSPCFKKRKLDESNLVDGAAIVGGARLVEFMSDGAPSISY